MLVGSSHNAPPQETLVTMSKLDLVAYFRRQHKYVVTFTAGRKHSYLTIMKVVRLQIKLKDGDSQL
jgi:hypothetical protein